MNRTKKVVINNIAVLLPYFILAIIGMFKTKIMISSLGDTYNGYYLFIDQLISYVFIAEAGFMASIVYKLYKPFSEDDKDSIRNIFYSGKKHLKKLGFLILGLLILFIPTIFFANDTSSVNMLEIIATYLLIGLSYTFTYFFGSAALFSVFSASGKKYLHAIVFNLLRILCEVLIIVTLLLNVASLFTIALIICFVKIIEEILMYIVGKKHFAYLYDGSKTTYIESISDMTKDVIVHKIGFVIFSKSDSILIMLFIGPIYVSIYSVYLFVSRFLTEIYSKISNNLEDIFGTTYIEDSKDKTFRLFNEHKMISICIGYLFTIPFILGIRSFVSVWITDTDINYIVNDLTVLGFAIVLFITILYTPLVTVINANGLYKESKSYVIICAIVNITLSIISLVFLPLEYKIAGLLFSTSIAYLVNIYLRVNLVTNKVFVEQKMTVFSYFKYIILFILIAIVLSNVENFIFNLNLNIILLVLLLGVIAFITFIIFTVFSLMFKTEFKTTILRIKELLKRRKSA